MAQAQAHASMEHGLRIAGPRVPQHSQVLLGVILLHRRKPAGTHWALQCHVRMEVPPALLLCPQLPPSSSAPLPRLASPVVATAPPMLA